jgi:hypothetical protein
MSKLAGLMDRGIDDEVLRKSSLYSSFQIFEILLIVLGSWIQVHLVIRLLKIDSIFIIIISHMPEVQNAYKNKNIAKPQPDRKVRLWVRAKFLSFRRYISVDSDRKSLKIPTRPSFGLKESMTLLLLNIILARE